MVWETHEVHKEDSRFPSLYLPSLPTTNIENTSGYAGASFLPDAQNEPETFLMVFASSSTFLACKSMLKVDF